MFISKYKFLVKCFRFKIDQRIKLIKSNLLKLKTVHQATLKAISNEIINKLIGR